MINKVSDFFNKYNISKSNTLVIAVSCGMDSLTLLDIVLKLNYNVVIAFVNHKKRQMADVEEEYIKDFAKKHNIMIETTSLTYSNSSNFHDEAHKLRYQFFENVLTKYNSKYLLTAHHQDDNLETILLNLMRGSNLYGYGGISDRVIYDNYQILRPLYDCSKDDIKKYIMDNNIYYFEDESNNHDDYKRNKIRHNIIPTLKEYEPKLLENIKKYSQILKESFSFIRNISIEYLNSTNNIIDISKFNSYDIAVKKDIICLLLEYYNIEKNIDTINDIIKVIDSDKTSIQIDLKNSFIFIKRYNYAYIKNKTDNVSLWYELSLSNKVIFNDKYLFYFTKKMPNSNAIYIKLCYNELVFPLIIRNYQQNDKIELSFGHKKINRLFIDKKIPLEDRQNIPIILNNNEIIWVYNMAKAISIKKHKASGEIYLVCEEIKNDK